MKCVIYTRYSPRPGGESESCNMQREECIKFIQKNGWDCYGSYSDENMSGSDPERPGLWAAMERVPRGGVLLVWKNDRLARDLYLNEALHRHAKKNGFTIQAIRDGPVDDSAEGNLIRQVLAAAAEYERRLIQARTSVAMKRHQKNGRRMSRFAPYGYKVDPNDETLLIKESLEQKALAHMIELRENGFGWKSICSNLTAAGYPPRGKSWDASSVRRIVQRSLQTA